MIKMAALVKIQTGKADEFIAAYQKSLPEVRKEPGTLQYDLCQQSDSPESFLFIEGYEDDAAHKAHHEGVALQQFYASVQSMMTAQPVMFPVVAGI